MSTNSTSPQESASHPCLKSPLRGAVHAVLYLQANELYLDEIRSWIDRIAPDHTLPRRWRILVREILKHDPMVEKTDEGKFVLRTDDAVADV